MRNLKIHLGTPLSKESNQSSKIFAEHPLSAKQWSFSWFLPCFLIVVLHVFFLISLFLISGGLDSVGFGPFPIWKSQCAFPKPFSLSSLCPYFWGSPLLQQGRKTLNIFGRMRSAFLSLKLSSSFEPGVTSQGQGGSGSSPSQHSGEIKGFHLSCSFQRGNCCISPFILDAAAYVAAKLCVLRVRSLEG